MSQFQAEEVLALVRDTSQEVVGVVMSLLEIESLYSNVIPEQGNHLDLKVKGR